jgi:arylsulfatase A-like enzyme
VRARLPGRAARTGFLLAAEHAPLRSGKGSAYEGDMRVPFVVRWPRAGGAPDRVVATPVQFEDVAPTIGDLVGRPFQAPDGISFAAAVHRGAAPLHPPFLHHPHYWSTTGPGIEPFGAVRDGDLKLVWF